MLNGYPLEIQQHLEDLTNLVVDTLEPKVIYLLGSTARGELSWLRQPTGKIELYSDYELAVITQHRPTSKKRHALQQKIRSLERQISNPNPLFHIDILLREQRRLAVMPRLIFTFEFKENGLLLYGEELRDALPDVTVTNLDILNTNEILYKRLWAILLHLPESFIMGHPTKAAQRVAGYSFCRNALDLTTVFLPSEGYLLPTYRQRVNALNENATSLNLLQYFDSDFPAFMQTCLNRRLDLDFLATDLLPLYVKTIDALEHGLLLLLQDTNIDTLPQISRHIFNEHPISRGEWYNLMRLAFQKTRRYGPFAVIRWLRLPVKGWLSLGLLMMHKSLLCWLTDKGQDAQAYLIEAEHALQTLSPNYKLPEVGSFPEHWFALRRAWGDVWLQNILLGAKPAEDRIKRVMEWHYA